MVMDYELLREEPHLISRSVLALIERGWEPAGAPFCWPGGTEMLVAQAMVKMAPEPKSEACGDVPADGLATCLYLANSCKGSACSLPIGHGGPAHFDQDKGVIWERIIDPPGAYSPDPCLPTWEDCDPGCQVIPATEEEDSYRVHTVECAKRSPF